RCRTDEVGPIEMRTSRQLCLLGPLSRDDREVFTSHRFQGRERSLMPKAKTIAFQGEPGANSHIACQEVYPKAEVLPCATFEDCFAAVREGRADFAMIPIDNSVAGRVADIHHLLPDSRLHIVGEHFLPIQFQLMAVKGARLKDIKSVHSHTHA